jgi:hypothetical protein
MGHGRRGSQVVRQGSAKASFVGSIPTLASNYLIHNSLHGFAAFDFAVSSFGRLLKTDRRLSERAEISAD